MVNIKDSIIPDPIIIVISSHSISNIGMTNINPAVDIITNNACISLQMLETRNQYRKTKQPELCIYSF